MSFLFWQREGEARIASSRLVLRAAEVPLVAEAIALRDRLVRLQGEAAERIAEAERAARQRGFEQGVDEGRRAAEAQTAEALLAVAGQAAAERERLRQATAALALQVVRKLLGPFADDAVLAALATTAAAELLPQQAFAVVVHPDQGDAVRARLAAQSSAAAMPCEVRTDAACARDACRLETEHGSIDASLEAQLARLEAAWRGAGDEMSA
jgi:flagellar biosynthesis/type III secretory pathway protein FliH